MIAQEQQLLRQLIERYNRLERRVNVLDTQEGGGGAVDSVNGATGVVVLDTDDIAEGATNKYLTQERVEDYVAAQFTGNTGLIDATYNDTTGAITLTLDVSAADKMLYSTAADTWAEATLTSFARTLLWRHLQRPCDTLIHVAVVKRPIVQRLCHGIHDQLLTWRRLEVRSNRTRPLVIHRVTRRPCRKLVAAVMAWLLGILGRLRGGRHGGGQLAPHIHMQVLPLGAR